jgi:hypothetical protein
MKLSEIFTRVKPLIARTHKVWCNSLADGPYRATYICYALEQLYLKCTISNDERTAAKLHINELLSGHTCLEYWIRENHPECEAEADSMPWEVSYKKFQTTRIAWLTSIIKDLQAQGR